MGDAIGGFGSLGDITAATDPLILNLTGGAVQTTDAASSSAQFDMLSAGAKLTTGWTTAGEGFLVLPNPDGTVTSAANFVTSFGALASYDGNNDGVIGPADPIFAQLRVWTNAAGDGAFQSSDLHSLAGLGISSISLAHSSVPQYNNCNVINATGTFSYSNGSSGAIADATLLSGDISASLVTVSDGTSTIVREGTGPAVQYVSASNSTVAVAAGVGIVDNIGTGNTIDLGAASGIVALGGVNSTINAQNTSDPTLVGGSGTTLNISSGKSQAYLEGNGGTINGAAGGTALVTVDGNSNTLNLGSVAVSAVIGGNSNTGSVGDNSLVSLMGISNGLNVGGASAVFISGADNAVNAGMNTAVSVTGAGDIITAGSGSAVEISGLGDLLALATTSLAAVNGTSDAATIGAGCAVVVNGVGDSISAGAGDVVTLGGSYNSLTAGSTVSVVSVAATDVVHSI